MPDQQLGLELEAPPPAAPAGRYACTVCAGGSFIHADVTVDPRWIKAWCPGCRKRRIFARQGGK